MALPQGFGVVMLFSRALGLFWVAFVDRRIHTDSLAPLKLDSFPSFYISPVPSTQISVPLTMSWACRWGSPSRAHEQPRPRSISIFPHLGGEKDMFSTQCLLRKGTKYTSCLRSPRNLNHAHYESLVSLMTACA